MHSLSGSSPTPATREVVDLEEEEVQEVTEPAKEESVPVKEHLIVTGQRVRAAKTR